MKTITIYELIGLVKDGKAPKKILIKDKVYYLLVDEKHYVYSLSKDIRQWDLFIDEKIRISQNLDLEVTILDENYLENKPLEEKKMPKKLDLQYKDIIYNSNFKEEILMYCDNLQDKLNEIIDYL